MLSVAGGFKGEILWALSLPNLSPRPHFWRNPGLELLKVGGKQLWQPRNSLCKQEMQALSIIKTQKYGCGILLLAIKIYLCVCVCVFILHPLLFPYKGGKKAAFNSA